MRILVSDGDSAVVDVLAEAFSPYGNCDIALDEQDIVDALILSLQEKNPYDIICLSLMSLKMDGLKVLRAIREKENLLEAEKTKIIFTSTAKDIDKVFKAFATKDELYTSGALDKDSIRKIIEENWPDKLKA